MSRILFFWASPTLRILPLSGRMAWKRRSRPCFAETAGGVSSNQVSSQNSGLFSEQSGQLPGSVESRRSSSEDQLPGLRADSRARADTRTSPRSGERRRDDASGRGPSCRHTMDSTVCGPRGCKLGFRRPSNCGLGSFTLTTGTSPWRTSSPLWPGVAVLISLFFLM